MNSSPPECAQPDSDFDVSRTPRCPDCAYIVLGLPSNRCPECGNLFEWSEVTGLAAVDPRLPVQQPGVSRWLGAARTWLLVLLYPHKFAQLVSHSGVPAATVFGAACIAIGALGNATFGVEAVSPREAWAWAVACWFHIECQSVLFFLLDLHRRNYLRQWMLWRNLSLYTTAFVVLDVFFGPPCAEPFRNYPLVVCPGSWDIPDDWITWLARGIVYHWWLLVLLTAVWLRLRRKWIAILIIPAMVAVTATSTYIGVAFDDLRNRLVPLVPIF